MQLLIYLSDQQRSEVTMDSWEERYTWEGRYTVGENEYRLRGMFGSGGLLLQVVRIINGESSLEGFADLEFSIDQVPKNADPNEWSLYEEGDFRQWIKITTHDGKIVTGKNGTFKIVRVASREGHRSNGHQG